MVVWNTKLAWTCTAVILRRQLIAHRSLILHIHTRSGIVHLVDRRSTTASHRLHSPISMHRLDLLGGRSGVWLAMASICMDLMSNARALDFIAFSFILLSTHCARGTGPTHGRRYGLSSLVFFRLWGALSCPGRGPGNGKEAL